MEMPCAGNTRKWTSRISWDTICRSVQDSSFLWYSASPNCLRRSMMRALTPATRDSKRAFRLPKRTPATRIRVTGGSASLQRKPKSSGTRSSPATGRFWRPSCSTLCAVKRTGPSSSARRTFCRPTSAVARRKMWLTGASRRTRTSEPLPSVSWQMKLPSSSTPSKRCSRQIASRAPSGRETARPSNEAGTAGCTGLMRTSRPLTFSRATPCSHWRTAEPGLQPSSSRTRETSCCWTASIQAAYRAHCSASRLLTKPASSPNISTKGRATPPHLGHVGRSPTTRCVTPSSTSLKASGAGQVSSQQGVAHCK
mmetsp:Transcript_18947/g.60084  ORF Transcript_18947/g.60084 Transcript_18947/m.60084 type:complete len:311 (+) Transcript_18947:953-1885(+)